MRFLCDPTFWTAVGSFFTALAFIYMIYQNSLIKSQTQAALEQSELARKEYKYNCAWQEKSRATDLAAYYKDEILPKIDFVCAVSDETHMKDLFCGIRDCDMKLFTKQELFSSVGDNILKRIDDTLQQHHRELIVVHANKHDDPEPLKVYFRALEKRMEADKLQNIAEKNKIIKQCDASITSVIRTVRKYYDREMSSLLNNLEYFAMNFTTGVADADTVYPSLHQTYIETVKKLYWRISIQNEGGKDKFYTHTIALYRQWTSDDLQRAEMADLASAPKRLCIEK